MKRSPDTARITPENVKSRGKTQDGSLDALLHRLEAGLASAEKLAREWRARSGSRTDTLRSLRDVAELSQAELARRAGTTQSHVAHIESGEKDPQTDMIARLAAALNVAPERVFSAIRGQRGKRKPQAKTKAGAKTKSKVAAKSGGTARKKGREMKARRR